MELAQFSAGLVMWRESTVCLLNISEKPHVEGSVAGAKLNDTCLIVGEDGVALPALERCRVYRRACNPFGLEVAFPLRRRSILLEEVRDLKFG